uniref:putative F-box protein At1g49610 isoform X2 n=1 Tax=Fragaria vesca subsp. vesca TaxID=101020 RepID=UPI0005C80D6F|nr:PREDICTED: putative F-box protein At1g49610 isoform X2 [Fragaria vesca subsp. vesca]
MPQRLCVLSRRWEHVWKFSASLDFELSFEDYLYLTCSRRLTKEKDQEYRRFIGWVDSVIGKHRAPTITRFRVCFGLNRHCLSFFVDRWIEFAMNKRVQILELTDHSNMYSFPQKLLGLEKESDLKLKRLDFADTPGYSTGFKFLRVLCFDYVHVTQEVLEHFLYNCPVLERLTVWSTNSLVGLRVSGPSITLKYLELIECGLRSVQICDTNLVSLTISQDAEISLLLNNVPSLVEISYDTSRSMDLPQFLTQISCCPQLEKLKLKLVVDHDPCLVFPNFAKLKHLKLEVDEGRSMGFQNAMCFLYASPYLEKLVLEMDRYAPHEYYMYTGNITEVAHRPHYHLKVVEIKEYSGGPCAKYVTYLINNAVALEKIVIKPVHHRASPGERNEWSEKETARARNHAMQLLKGKAPSSIEFVCM